VLDSHVEGGSLLRVLITNDDGIAAPGLWALAEEFNRTAEVVVVAPDREQSGVGTSVSLHSPLRVRSVRPVVPGIETYAVEGTPADSVIIALRMLLKDKLDLVVSGINEGSNLGTDVLISGTVGAAFQAYFYGLPAIAVSVASFSDSCSTSTCPTSPSTSSRASISPISVSAATPTRSRGAASSRGTTARGTTTG